MKRIVTLVLMLGLMLGLATLSHAAGSADIYEKGSGTSRLESVSGDLTPGTTYYIMISDTKPSKTRASLSDVTGERRSDGKSISLISSKNLTIEKKGVVGGDYYWFAVLKIKDISLSNYDEEGYDLYAEMECDGDEWTIEEHIAYPDGDGEVEDTPKFFYFDDEEDEVLDLPYDDATMTINSRGVETKVILSMNTDYNENIGDKYPNADLTFLNGTQGGTLRRDAEIYIPGDRDLYLYEIKNGSLTDLTRYYKSSEDGFVFNTKTLGKYILSDRKLEAVDGLEDDDDDLDEDPPSGGSSGGSTVNSSLYNIISTNFRNSFQIINYGTVYEGIGSTVTLKCQLDLTALNKSTLRVYVYNASANQLIPLSDAGAYVGADGALYFRTSVKGYYVVTDSALAYK